MSHSTYPDMYDGSYLDSKPTSPYDQYYRAMSTSSSVPPRRLTRIFEPADLAVRRYDPIDANMPYWFRHTRNKESTTYAADAAHRSMWHDVQGRRAQDIGWSSKSYVSDGGYGGRMQYVNDRGYGARQMYKSGRGVEEEEQSWWYGRKDRWVAEKPKETPLFRKEKMYIVRRR